MCFVKVFNCGDFGWFDCRMWHLIILFPPAKYYFNNSVSLNAFVLKAATNAVIVGIPVTIWNFLLTMLSERHFRIFANWLTLSICSLLQWDRGHHKWISLGPPIDSIWPCPYCSKAQHGHCVYCCLRRKSVQWHGMHICLCNSWDSRRLNRNFPWEHATTSSHELQNFEQKILYRVVTHARYIKKWVLGADFLLIRHTSFIFFSLRKSTYDVFLTFPVVL